MSAGPGAAEGADQTPNGAKGDQTTETGRVPSLATQSSNTYRRPNGTYRTIAYGTPVNYQDEYGLWQPIDNRLVASSSAGYAAENAANSYDVKVPAQGSQAPFRFSVGHAWVQMRMHGLQAAPEVSGDTATFDSGTAASRVDYTAVATGLKEDIILDSAPGSAPRFVYDFHTSPGLTPGTAANGGIDFKTSDGDVPFQIPPGLMYDSATPAANSDNVTFDLTGSKNDWTLTVTPDNSWLQDAARTYPVTIDPSLVAQPVVRDCEIRSDSPDSHICGNGDLAGYVRAGLTSSGAKRRGLLDFDTSSIPAGSQILSADINLYLDTASSTGSTGTDLAFYTAGKKFNGQPTWHDSGLSGPWNGGSPGATAYSTRHFGGTGLTGYKAFDGMVGLIQGWADGSIAHTGLVLKQVTESDNRQLWFYSSSTATSNDGKRPYLDVTYDLPAEHLMSGVVLDGSGVPVAGANVSISVENDQVDTGRTDELPLVHGVTNQNGGFSLTGNYIGPATLNDDGSMRLQVALSSPDLDRFYLINAMPPSDAGGTWTWSSAPDTAAVGHPADADDMVGTAVTDLRFILDPQQGVVPTPSAPTSSGGSTALAADGSTTMSYSADSPGSISAADVADSGANYPVAEEYDPDDPTGADATNPTTNAAAEEADAAREFRPCATGSGETWWEGLDSYKRRYTPIWYSNIAGNATEHYDWKTTTMTLIKPAIVGAGANYAGGLSLSVEKNHATNVSQTYNTAYVKQYFGVQWKFREQKLMCFNAGYTYDTGRRRWFPINFTTGAKNISTSYDFTCKAVNKATTSAQETTIADGKSVTFDLSFSIGLGDMQKYNDDESHVTYKKRATANSYTLCGKGADPGQAKIVKEVVS